MDTTNLEQRVWLLEKRDRLYLESTPKADDWRERSTAPEVTTDFVRAWLDEVDRFVPGARISVHSAGQYRGRYLKANPPA